MPPEPPPGVVWQDVFPPPPRSLLTGVPAIVGRAGAGPADAVRLTLWPQFVAAFGPSTPGFLADAVHGFFANDGVLCYVVRLDERLPAEAALAAALAQIEDLGDVDLVCAPDSAAAGAQQAMLADHCRRLGDRFAILDGAPGADTMAIRAQADRLTGPAGAFAALYHPWLWTLGATGRPHYVPPSGHVAGIYSRSDRRVGVHKAPANEVVEDVLDLASAVTAAEAGELNGAGVDCLRAYPGRGIRVSGARTLAAAPEWRDVGTRRLVGSIVRWIERFMTGLVHEPNDVRLWVRIMRELTAYLDGLFQRGALRGRTAAEAFYVKCDSETNPPEAIEAGMVVTHVGVAPAVPAEFITVRLIHGPSGVTADTAQTARQEAGQ